MLRSFLVSMLLFVLSSGAFAQPVKRILLEEFTTAPCGFCPDGDIVAEQLVRDHPQVIWMSHHAGFGTDSLTVAESVPIANAFTIFAPGACIDRGDYPIPVYTKPGYIAISRQKWDSVCVAHLGDAPGADVAIVNRYDPVARLLDCTVDVTFTTAPVPGDLRVQVYVVEDSAIGYGKGFDQVNYYNGTAGHPCYQRGDPIVGYSHRRVLRAASGGSWGRAGIIPSAPAAGSRHTATFTDIPISTRWQAEALDVIAFVSYHNADTKLRQVINSNSRRMTDSEPVAADPVPLPGSTGIVVTPNPASTHAVFRAGADMTGSGTVHVTNILGEIVASLQLGPRGSAATLPVAALPNGFYFYRTVSVNGMAKTGSLLVLH